MEAFVQDNDLGHNIILLGILNKLSIALEMQQANAFVHASNYETFSVVCAEALCCGTPVIASNVGGIPEFVNESNGILVENNVAAWRSALAGFLGNRHEWDSLRISQDATKMFSPAAVGEKIAGSAIEY